MKTAKDIREIYITKVIEYSEKQDEDAGKWPDGSPRDRSKEITVTDICAWDTYCSRQTYYNKICKRSVKPEALMRFTIGHAVHVYPVWEDGNEVSFSWNGLRCRMDDINFEEGIICDKKTVASMPRAPKPYVTKQLNIYRVIAEDNEKRPVRINQLFAINVAIMNGEIEVQEIPMWDKTEAINYINKMIHVIKDSVENKLVPEATCGSKGWICENCSYTDLCAVNSTDGTVPISAKKENKAKIPIHVNKSV